MGARKAGVRVVPSPAMKGSKEREYVRVPKIARSHFEFNSGLFNLFAGDRVVALKVKPAYKKDAYELKKKIDSGELTVDDAQITCFVSPETFKHFSPASSSFSYLSLKIENIKVGGDPEFVLVNPSTKRFQYAEHVSGLSLSTQLGHDGPLAEVRPPPADSAQEMVNSIKRILHRDKKKISRFDWYSGATFKSPTHPTDRIVQIGGHIQFGNPKCLPISQKSSIYKNIVHILDETVGVALVKIDTPLPYHRRNKKWGNYGNYGRWGDFKAKANRFEWRVPSGIWLAHPDIAQAVVGTSRAVVISCYQDMADRCFANSWVCARETETGFLKSRKIMSATRAEEIINEADPKKVSAALLKKIATKLRALSTYSEYKPEIDEFIKLTSMGVRNRNKINLNLKDTWLGGKGIFVER